MKTYILCIIYNKYGERESEQRFIAMSYSAVSKKAYDWFDSAGIYKEEIVKKTIEKDYRIWEYKSK